MLFCAAFAVAVSALSAPSRADVPDVNGREREVAAARFTEGEQAFSRGEYARAGELFEQAHQAAPHHDAAWNAAQAWLRAGETARAATWLAVYLTEAPEGAPDRAEAKAKHDELAPRLGRIDVRAPDGAAVTIDGRQLRTAWTYAPPGAHVVDARGGAQAVVPQRVEVAAGGAIAVTLAPAAAPAPALAPPPPTKPTKPTKLEPRDGREAARSGWPPIVVVAGGIVTAGLGATTIVLGAATERAHDDFAATGSRAAYDDGRTKQDLTNGFFWGTVAAGALTAAVAIFFTDWKRPVFAF